MSHQEFLYPKEGRVRKPVWLVMLVCLSVLAPLDALAQSALAQSALAQSANTAETSAAPTPASPDAAGKDSTVHQPLRPDPAFVRYPQYRGTMDGRAIVLRIGVKADDRDELNGEYQYLPNGPVTLIAGGRDGKTLTLEESDDGTEISGQWVGFFADDGSLSGDRMDPDNSHAVSFDLRPVRDVSGSGKGQGAVSAAAPNSPANVSPAASSTPSSAVSPSAVSTISPGKGPSALANSQGRP